jgi:aspartate/glutamate racemase
MSISIEIMSYMQTILSKYSIYFYALMACSRLPTVLKNEAQIDAFALGGTELPLILRNEMHNGIPFLITTRIHCEAAATETLA